MISHVSTANYLQMSIFLDCLWVDHIDLTVESSSMLSYDIPYLCHPVPMPPWHLARPSRCAPTSTKRPNGPICWMMPVNLWPTRSDRTGTSVTSTWQWHQVITHWFGSCGSRHVHFSSPLLALSKGLGRNNMWRVWSGIPGPNKPWFRNNIQKMGNQVVQIFGLGMIWNIYGMLRGSGLWTHLSHLVAICASPHGGRSTRDGFIHFIQRSTRATGGRPRRRFFVERYPLVN